MNYRIYIDEVGNSDLESSDNPNHRYLSLTGIIMGLDYVAEIVQPDIEGLKSRFFHPHPDDPLVFHRKDMLNAKPPFMSLKDRRVRCEFNEELLRLLSTWIYVVITVCLDKKRHKETYHTWRFDPYHYCLALLLERYVLFLKRNDSYGDALAESRGGKEDRRLKDSFERLYNTGTDFIEAALFLERLTSCQLKVKPKANNIAGLQIADMIAHPSRNEILEENGVNVSPKGLLGAKLGKSSKRNMIKMKTEYMGRSLFKRKKRPLRARWHSPSTSGNPDYY
ncbi:MAG: DUF3800 domain-containing protein [Candidatus Aminicenantales bacterium]